MNYVVLAVARCCFKHKFCHFSCVCHMSVCLAYVCRNCHQLRVMNVNTNDYAAVLWHISLMSDLLLDNFDKPSFVKVSITHFVHYDDELLHQFRTVSFFIILGEAAHES